MRNTLLFIILLCVGSYLSAQNHLVAYEYWFNGNEGARHTELIDPATRHSLIANIDASGLSDGVNVLNIRYKDENGLFSSTLSQLFYKNAGHNVLNNKLVSYEYWFNNDNINSVTEFLAPESKNSISASIDVSGLPDGVNVFNIRYKDENGMYSSPFSQLFYKSPAQLPANNKLVSCEYWFNNNDNKKSTENLPTAGMHSFNTNLDVSDLPEGVNVFNIRYKDESGVYSSTLSSLFYKTSKNQVAENKISAYRFWLDSDFEQVKTIELAPEVSLIALAEDIDLSFVPKGMHAIHFQYKDLLGAWSVVSTDSITKTANPIAAFSFSNSAVCANNVIDFENESSEADSWLWDFGDGNSSTEFNPGYTYTTTGDFNVSLIATDSDSGLKDTVIHLISVNSKFENSVTDEICSSEIPYIFGLQQLTQNGNYTEIFQTINGCDSIVHLILTVNPSYTEVDSKIVCESEVPVIFGTQSLVSSGEYTETFRSVNGCDSVVTLTLLINPTYSKSETKTVCSNELPVVFGSQLCETGGNYTEIFETVNNCDSTVYLTLVVNEVINTTLADFIYVEDLPYIFGKQQLTKTGFYNETFLALNGCDSTVNLTLTVIDTSLVTDKTPPAVKCNEIDIYLNEEGRYVLKTGDIKALSAGTTDNISAPDNIFINVFRKSFNCNDSGREVEVEVTATDEAGNEASCTVNLMIRDTFSLKIEPVEDIELVLDAGICETPIAYPALVSSNNCAEFKQISGLGADGIYPLGITKEEWILTGPSGDSLAFSFNVTVSSVNDLPTVKPIANVSIEEDLPNLKIPVSGISHGNDCNVQDIEVRVSNLNTALITDIFIEYTSPDSTAIINLTFAPDMSGADEITVVVNDNEGGSVFETFAVTVVPVNDPPVVVNPLPDFKLNASFPLKFTLSDAPGGTFTDVDNTDLTYELSMEDGSNFPNWVGIKNDTLIFTPLIADTSCISVVIKAFDSSGGVVADTFKICVEGYPTGNDNIEDPGFDIQMFPNPAKGVVNLKMISAEILDSEVIVRNIAGSEVFRKKYLAADLIKLNLSGYVSGIYLVTVKSRDNFVIKKLILDK